MEATFCFASEKKSLEEEALSSATLVPQISGLIFFTVARRTAKQPKRDGAGAEADQKAPGVEAKTDAQPKKVGSATVIASAKTPAAATDSSGGNPMGARPVWRFL